MVFHSWKQLRAKRRHIFVCKKLRKLIGKRLWRAADRRTRFFPDIDLFLASHGIKNQENALLKTLACHYWSWCSFEVVLTSCYLQKHLHTSKSFCGTFQQIYLSYLGYIFNYSPQSLLMVMMNWKYLLRLLFSTDILDGKNGQ